MVSYKKNKEEWKEADGVERVYIEEGLSMVKG